MSSGERGCPVFGRETSRPETAMRNNAMSKNRIGLVWIYMGRTPAERLETVGTIDGSRMELVAVGNVEVQRAAELFSFAHPGSSIRTLDSVSMKAIWSATPEDVAALVFWVDDGKPVASTFPLEMAAPLLGPEANADQHLHYWDGNALAVSRAVAEALPLEDMALRDDCLLTLMSDLVDRGTRLPGQRLRLMFSPRERFETMELEPVGIPS